MWHRLLAVTLVLAAAVASAAEPLPDPLKLDDVLAIAREHRGEIAAARARARAAGQRPAIVSALDDPEVSTNLNHLPFMLGGADVSLTFEQRFPLSRVLGHRRSAAEAEAGRLTAEAGRVGLDVELEAAAAFYMLHERRGLQRVFAEQRDLAKQLVASATARYATGGGAQADVLRAEIELARLEAQVKAIAADVRGAEAMLEASMGNTPSGAVPPLDAQPPGGPPAAAGELMEQAVQARPELKAARAEIDRADAELRAMGSMYLPMGMVRTGPGYTMGGGAGWMVMVGVSVPLWRGRLQAGLAEADAMADMARADQQAMQRMVEGEAASAREQVEAARTRYLALRDDVVPRARAALQPTLAAYVSGQLPLVSVVEAAQALWMAQGDLVMAEAELGLAWARLARARGATGRQR